MQNPLRLPGVVHTDVVPGLVCFLFFLGIILGSVVGCFFSAAPSEEELSAYISGEASAASLLSSASSSFAFILLALFLGTTYLGVFLIPMAIVVKAYTMSCTVSVMLVSFGGDGLRYAALAIALPSLLLIPCFLLCAADAFRLSRRLYGIRFQTPGWGGDEVSTPGHLLFVLAGTILAAGYHRLLLPIVLAHIL